MRPSHWALISVAAVVLALCLAPGSRADVGANGDYRTAIPIVVPPYHGLEPALRIAYSSAGGNGWLGVGWTLSGASRISRASVGRGAPTLGSSDRFYLDGMELVPCTAGMTSPSCLYPASPTQKSYSTWVESYERIAFAPSANQWYVWSKTGVKSTYTAGHALPGGTFAWELSSVEDTLGNKVVYSYTQDATLPTRGERYLSTIAYNGTLIRFWNQRRLDTIEYATGADLVTMRFRLKTIEVRVGNARARAYQLRYEYRAATTERSALVGVKVFGRDAKLTPSGTVTGGTALPPSTFHDEARISLLDPGRWDATTSLTGSWGTSPGGGGTTRLNFDADTVIPWYEKKRFRQWFPGDVDGDGRTDYMAAHLEQLPGTPPGANQWFVTLRTVLANRDGNGPGAYRQPADQNTGWLWDHNPSLDFMRTLVGDVNNDGLADFIVITNGNNPGAGPFLRTAISNGDGTFTIPAPQQLPTNWDPRHRWLTGDVDGDGRTDLMIAERRVPCTPQCGCAAGSVSEHAVLHVGFSNGDGTYRFTAGQQTCWSFNQWDDAHWFAGDANGDGRRDFMRIVNHEPHVTGGTKHAAFEMALSRGDGTFTIKTADTSIPWSTYQYPIPYFDQPFGTDLAQTGDFNGDGKTDFVFMGTRRAPGAPLGVTRIVFWFAFSKGDGTFLTIENDTLNTAGGIGLTANNLNFFLSTAGSSATPQSPNRWLAGDFNGDGATDLAIVAPRTWVMSDWLATGTNANLRYLISNRRGSFSIGPVIQKNWFYDCYDRDLTVNGSPCPNDLMSFVFTGDANGDGPDDIMYAGLNETASGARRTSFRVEVSPKSVLDTSRFHSADVDGDGAADLVHASYDNPGIRIDTVRHPSPASGGYTLQSNVATVPAAEPYNPVARDWLTGDVGSAGGVADGREDFVHVLYYDDGPSHFGVRVYTFFSDGSSWVAKFAEPLPSFARRDTGNWRLADVSGDGRADLVHVGWLNPGIRVNTLISNGDGTWTSAVADPWPGFGSSDIRNWIPADVNGDGRSDLIHVFYATSPTTSIRVHVLLSNGDGTWTSRSQDRSSVPLRDVHNWRPGDFNGDGKADLAYVESLASNEVGVHTLLGHGDGTWTERFERRPANALDPSTTDWRVLDYNGDGRSDLVRVGSWPCTSTPNNVCTQLNSALWLELLLSHGDGTWRWAGGATVAVTDVPRDPAHWLSSEGDGRVGDDLLRVDYANPVLRVTSIAPRIARDVLTDVRSSTGARTEISYSRSAFFAVNRPASGCYLLPHMGQDVVEEVAVRDGLTSVRDSQTYDYDCAHWSQRHRMPLGWSRVAIERTGVLNRPASLTLRRYAVSDACLSQEQDDEILENAVRQHRTITAYNPSGLGAPFRCTVLYRNELDYAGPLTARNVYTYFTYDAFGNVTHVVEEGDSQTTGDERTTYRSFHAATGPYIVGLPWFEQVFKGASPATTMLRSTFFCWDGDNGTDFANCTAPPTKGLLTATKQVDSLGLYVTTTFQYDSRGSVAAVMGPRHFGRTVFYDSTYRTYPTFTCNALLPCSEYEWDPVIGRITKITDANKKVTTFTYDALGRLKKVVSPNAATRTTQYLDFGNVAKQHVRESGEDGSSDGLWQDRYFDGLGRTYRTVKEGDAPGKTFVQKTLFSDASVLPHRQSEWFRPGSTVHQYETYFYDASGRPRQQTHGDGSSVVWSYGVDGSRLTTTTTSEVAARQKIAYEDPYGRVEEVRERKGATWVKTAYEFDAADQIISVTDDLGNKTTNTWDILGHLTKTVDPDLGTRTFRYDLGGNLTQQTDAKNKTITYTYDGIDRLKSKLYPDGSQSTWTYDEANHGASKGRLTSVVDPTGTNCAGNRTSDYTYDDLGEIVSTSKCVDGKSYTSGVAYDKLGRIDELTYPDGEKVLHKYNPAGHLASIPGYVDALAYDAAGRVVRAAYANGTTSTYRYKRGRGWVQSISAAHGPTPVFNATYSYRSDGLVGSSTSGTNQMNQTFGYDDLGRLTTVSGNLAQTFQYDSVGDILTNSGVGAYSYPAPGPSGCTGAGGQAAQCPRPHAAAAAGTESYTYDANGNLSSIYDTATQKYRGIDWTFDQQPFVVSDAAGVTTTYAYDAAGERVSRQRAGDYTRYFGPLADHSNTLGLTKYYYAGSRLVAHRDASGTYWHHHDRLGSTRALTDTNGAVVRRTDYRPFGDVASSTGTAATQITFGGGRSDPDNGLLYLGARYLDPRVGRFVSPDTIVPDLLKTQAVNRYAYAYDNPVSYVDPTGHEPDDVGDAPAPEDEELPVDPDYPMGVDLVAGFGWWHDENGQLHTVKFADDKPPVKESSKGGPSGDPGGGSDDNNGPTISAGEPVPLSESNFDTSPASQSEIAGWVGAEDVPYSWSPVPSNPSTPEHNEQVARTVNHFLSDARVSAAANATRYDIVNQAWSQLARLRASSLPKSSESLVLRDAERYLIGRLGPVYAKQTFGTSDFTSNYVLPRAGPIIWEGVKMVMRPINAGLVGIGVDPVATQIDKDKPQSAVGGIDWFDLGVTNYFDRDWGPQPAGALLLDEWPD